MNQNIFRNAFVTLIGITLLASSAYAKEAKRALAEQGMPAPAQGPVEESSNSGLVRHLVFFRYMPGTSDKDVKMITTRFLALKHECKRNGKPYVVSIDVGGANSPEGADLGLTHAFLVTFKSENDRDYYVGRLTPGKPGTAILKNSDGSDLYEPAHDQFKIDVGPYLYVPTTPVALDTSVGNGVMVFDFTTDKFKQ